MHKAKSLIIGLAVLTLTAGRALAQPWPGMGGPPPMPHYYHHHHRLWYPGYGPWPGHWHRGDRFYGPPYVVIRDYGYYRLAPPPPGYYWVQSGGQFLMIAIASGIIASILTAPMH